MGLAGGQESLSSAIAAWGQAVPSVAGQ